MESLRFERFTSLIDGIHKSINRLKLDKVPKLGIKSVHVSWLYHLIRHPEGMTAAEIAQESRVDRSLVSREIAALKKDGYLALTRGRYYVLTESGREIADRLVDIISEVQSVVDRNISEEELLSFYSTLEKLEANFAALADK